MILTLVVIIIFFEVVTGGKLIWQRNVTMLVRQNVYVLILAIGMMLCILTGGNIDLAHWSPW
jgi:putative multiple sugar transport system permease protein